MSKLTKEDIQNTRSIIIGIVCVCLAIALFSGVLPAFGINLPTGVGGALGGAVGVLAWFAIIKRGKA